MAINKFKNKVWLKDNKEIKEFRDYILKNNQNRCELSGDKIIRPCLDHDHVTGQCRGVISQHFNTYEGRVLKYWGKYCKKYTDLTLPQFLRKLADYYERDWGDRPLHYGIVGNYSKKLNYMKKEEIINLLKENFNISVASSTKKDDLIKIYCKTIKTYCERKKVE